MFSSSREIFQRTCAFFGIFNNSILALLILYRSPKKLGNYKFLMMYISIFETLYSLLDFSTIPEIFSKDYVFLIIIEKRLTVLPNFLLQCALIIFGSLFGMSMAIFAIHFVYRYLVMTGSQFIKTHHLLKVLGLIGFTLCMGVAWSFLHSSYHPIPQADIFLDVEYLKPRNLQLTEISYSGPCFQVQDEKGVLRMNWDVVGTTGVMILLISLSFSTVFYCGISIYKNIKSMTSMRSSLDQSLQSQLFYALVFQTLIPVILMHIPASFGFLVSIFGNSIQLFGQLPTFSIFLFPMLDPLPNFFIIRSYRQAITEFFGCILSTTSSHKTDSNHKLEMRPRAAAIVVN
ncbi:Seven TM Receptor [Caenorhabditis elegans]|uniref:Seven TM Receptor n=1 Tax=Caenorhabditis elegans TaxID=6239 RepID=O44654_CAEEL|nr:Seven TM Receptor [Caenorhabditis elegans]CCD61359.1 Seven TM Receptor [Caenorhabditis elegans]|eukprot:NP_504098.2 Seven TM Receptor [Caenorhabditis elegans]